MGLKIVKFHAIVHMADGIMNFGVPMNYDTCSDQSRHKPAKAAAEVTQKRKEYFDKQVGTMQAVVQALNWKYF
jgi:hypothetical protein